MLELRCAASKGLCVILHLSSRIIPPPAAPHQVESAAYPTLNSALAALKLSTTARAFNALGLDATLGAANPLASASAVTLFVPSEAAWATFLANNTLGLTTANLLDDTTMLDQLMRYHMLFDSEAGPAPLPLVRKGEGGLRREGGREGGRVGREGARTVMRGAERRLLMHVCPGSTTHATPCSSICIPLLPHASPLRRPSPSKAA